MVPLVKDLQWGNVKQEPFTKIRCVHAYSGMLRHIQTYSGIFRNYSGIFRTHCNPGIFRSLTYTETWYIQRSEIFRICSIFRNPFKYLR